MEIRRLSLLEGAREAEGVAVIIDVYRAFSTAAYVAGNGAERIIPVSTVEEAFKLKREHPDWLLMGEQHGVKVEGFDYGNSPFDVASIDFTGKTVVHRTSSGTQGINLARGADEVLLGSFVMAEATARYIRSLEPEVVSLVAMGWEGEKFALEDELCAEYLEERILRLRPDFQQMRRRILLEASDKFFQPGQTSFRPEDPDLCLWLDRFDFALGVEKGRQPEYVKA